MKQNDKVYCIKTHAKTPKERNNNNIYEGKLYTISEIYTDSVYVNDKIFKLIKNDMQYLYFDDYFLTEKNVRRYKLNKISEQ